MPAHVIVDGGHAAGRRLRDYAFFDDPDDPRNALLVECGQHWESGAPDVARQVTLRFLRHFGMAEAALLDRHLEPLPMPAQKVIEVTDAITIGTDAFAFAIPVHGLSVVPAAGTLLARDGMRGHSHALRRLRVDHADPPAAQGGNRGAPGPNGDLSTVALIVALNAATRPP